MTATPRVHTTDLLDIVDEDDWDDPIARQRSLDQLNAVIVRLVGAELLTVRVDLDT